MRTFTSSLALLGLLPSLACPAIGTSPTALIALPSSQEDAATEDEPLYAVPTLRDRVGRLVAPVFVNGQGPFRFLLDTGATHSAITEIAATRLNLTPLTSARVLVQGVNGSVEVPSVDIGELTAGAVRLVGTRMPLLSNGALDGLDGVLGMDGLGDMRVTADFRNDRVTIAKSSGREPSRSYTVMRGQLVSKRLFMVDAYVGRLKIKAVIDTGATHTLGNPALLVKLAKRRAFKSKAPIASVADATETLKSGEMHITPQINFRGTGLRNTDVTFSDFEIFKVWGLESQPAVLVGMDVLGTLSELSIDYRRQELQLVTRDAPLVRRM